MQFNIDISSFEKTKHTPALSTFQSGNDQPIVDYCIPVNPYFPTQEMMRQLHDNLDQRLKYYPDTADNLIHKLALFLKLPAESLVLANGSTELITWIDHLFIESSVVVPIPTFGRWTDQSLETGKKVIFYQRQERDQFHLDPRRFAQFVKSKGAKVAVLCNPNNPTGAINSRAEIRELLTSLSDLDLVVIDESFIDFSTECPPSVADIAPQFDNVIVLKSLGKSCGLHGVRLGCAIAHPKLAQRLGAVLPKWNINGVGQALIEMLPDNKRAFETARRQVIADRRHFVQELQKIGSITVFPSQANFVYVKIPDSVDGPSLRNTLLRDYGFLTRQCENKFGSSGQFFRIAIRSPQDMQGLLSALKNNFIQERVRVGRSLVSIPM